MHDVGRIRCLGLAPALLTVACYTGLPAHEGEVRDTDPAAEAGGDADAGQDGGSESGDLPPGADEACVDDGELVGAAPLRRLTGREYRYTIEDLLDLGELAEPALAAHAYIVDGRAGPFATSTLPPDVQVMRTYLTMSEDLADLFVQHRLPDAIDCDHAEAACVETFLRDFGRRAFRRPLTDAEIDTYLQLHADTLAEGPGVAVRTVVTALLVSPGFLYREEPADVEHPEGCVVDLDPYALASRLSFLLWSSGPDDELLDAAEANALDDAGVRAQVERMIDDPRFVRTVHGFYEQWVGLGGLDSVGSDDPAWSNGLRDSMRTETLRFVEDLHGSGSGTIADLFNADYGFVDADLAALYGVDAPAAPFEKVAFDPSERAGLLTQAGVLTVLGTAQPVVHRGLFVRERILCETPPAPPDIELDPEVDRLETQPCVACHVLTDLIGFGFARYDALGRWSDVDADGATIGQSGEVLRGAGTFEGTFEGPRGLAELLAGHPQVDRCMVEHWATFAAGRMESEADAGALDALAQSVRDSGGDLRALVVELASSRWLRSRSISEFE